MAYGDVVGSQGESCKGSYDTTIKVQRFNMNVGPDEFDVEVKTNKSCECFPPGVSPEVKKCDIDKLPELMPGMNLSEKKEYTCKEYKTECTDPPHKCGDPGWCPCPDTPTPEDWWDDEGNPTGNPPWEEGKDTFRNLPGVAGRIEDFANDNIAAGRRRLGTCTRPGLDL